LNRLLVTAVATATAVLLLPAQTARAAAANHRPATPTGLSLSGVACGNPIGTRTPDLGAWLTDPDFGLVAGERVTATFAIWPAGHPRQRTESTSPALVSAGLAHVTQATPLVNGGRYVLRARATDAAGAVSPWSPKCTFTVDTTVPAAPTVTSTDYPATGEAGGPGVTGRFTFAAAPDDDVVKFRYSPGVQEVAAGPDGKATIDYTPDSVGSHSILVQAIDRTGNLSAQTTYSFTVRDPDPRVVDNNPGGGVNEPRTVTFSSAVPGVTSYTYRFNDGAPITVPAGGDRSATVTLTPDRSGDNFLYVTSRTSAGVVSAEVRASLSVYAPTTPPTIISPDFPSDGTAPPLVGQEVTFTFQPGMAGVTEYDWSTDMWETKQTVTANPDGTATLRLTLARQYPYFEIFVRSRTATGFESGAAYGGWELTSHAPIVESADYPQYGSGSGPGVFTFRPAHDGVTGYDYTVNGGDPVTVTGATATVTWNPTQPGATTFVVREHIGAIISDPTEYTFTVTE
jgi:hypothetical protein